MAPAICLSQLLVFARLAPFWRTRQLIGSDLGLLVLLGVGQMGSDWRS